MTDKPDRCSDADEKDPDPPWAPHMGWISAAGYAQACQSPIIQKLIREARALNLPQPRTGS